LASKVVNEMTYNVSSRVLSPVLTSAKDVTVFSISYARWLSFSEFVFMCIIILSFCCTYIVNVFLFVHMFFGYLNPFWGSWVTHDFG